MIVLNIDESQTIAEIDKIIYRFCLLLIAEVKKRTPIDTGIARNSIQVIRESMLNYIIGTNLNYFKYFEEGTEPYEIVPRLKKALYWQGARHPVKKVKHPGIKARKIFEGVINDEALLIKLLKQAI